MNLKHKRHANGKEAMYRARLLYWSDFLRKEAMPRPWAYFGIAGFVIEQGKAAN